MTVGALRDSWPIAHRVVVFDTGALARDVVQGSRGPRLTSLLAALDQGGARGFVTVQIADEIERHFSDIVTQADDLDLVRRRWRQLYLPRLVIVDRVPTTWGENDARVRAIRARHRMDAPLAQLAVALAPCVLFAEDPDLVETVGATAEWLDVSHALANEGAYEDGVVMTMMTGALTSALIGTAVRGIGRLPTLIRIGLLVAGGVAVAQASRRGNLTAASSKLKGLTESAFEVYGPGFEKFTGWVETGTSIREGREVAPLADAALDERVARALAVSAHPMTASEIAAVIEDPAPITERTAAVRSILSLHPLTFIPVSRWRYQLGSGPTGGSALADDEVATYRANRRRHLSFPPRPADPGGHSSE